MPKLNEFDDLWPTPGHLDESTREAELLLGRAGRGIPIPLSSYIRKAQRQYSSISGGIPKWVSKKLRGFDPKGRAPLSTFHFRQTHVSRTSIPTIESLKCRRGYTAVFPTKQESAAFRKDTRAFYDKRQKVWLLPNDHPDLSTIEVQYLTTKVAFAKRIRSLTRSGLKWKRGKAARFQCYLECAGKNHGRRSEKLLADERGFISVGNIGLTLSERTEFWFAIEKLEFRANARIQNRLEAELPHWLLPSDHRIIAERLADFLAERKLAHWIVVHNADVSKGGDSRNVHLHGVYVGRALIGWSVSFVRNQAGNLAVVRGDPILVDKVEREIQLRRWVETLREEFSRIVNEQIHARAAITGQSPERWFFPGSFTDLSIPRVPTLHVGPSQTALLRRGFVPTTEARNCQQLEIGERRRIRFLYEALDRVGRRLEAIEVYLMHSPNIKKHGSSTRQSKVRDHLAQFHQITVDYSRLVNVLVTAVTLTDSVNEPLSRGGEVGILDIEPSNELLHADAAPPLTIVERLDNAIRRRVLEGEVPAARAEEWRAALAKSEGVESIDEVIRRRRSRAELSKNILDGLRPKLNLAHDMMSSIEQLQHELERLEKEDMSARKISPAGVVLRGENATGVITVDKSTPNILPKPSNTVNRPGTGAAKPEVRTARKAPPELGMSTDLLHLVEFVEKYLKSPRLFEGLTKLDRKVADSLHDEAKAVFDNTLSRLKAGILEAEVKARRLAKVISAFEALFGANEKNESQLPPLAPSVPIRRPQNER